MRHFLLSTDADAAAFEEVRSELHSLLDYLKDAAPGRTAPEEETERVDPLLLVAVEWLGLSSRIRELLRRREVEYVSLAQAYRSAYDERGLAPCHARLVQLENLLENIDQMVRLWGEPTGRPETPPTRSSGTSRRDSNEPSELAEVRLNARAVESVATLLQQCTRQLEKLELHRDAHVENDPRENGAHTQWSQRPISFGPPTLAPINATVLLALADERPALGDSVQTMLQGLMAVVASVTIGYGVATVAPAGSKPILDNLQADALVTVLLLIPGILLSRLDLPRTNSVLGRLRQRPRRIAQGAVVVTSGLAVIVAGLAWPNWVWPFGLLALGLLGCLLLAHRRGLKERSSERDIPPAGKPVPAWLGDLKPGPQRRMAPPPDELEPLLRKLREGVVSEDDREVVNDRPVDEHFAANREPRPTDSETPMDGLRLRRGSDLVSAKTRALARNLAPVRLLVTHGAGPVCSQRHADETDHVDERLNVLLEGSHAHAALDAGEAVRRQQGAEALADRVATQQWELVAPGVDVQFPGVAGEAYGRAAPTSAWTLEALLVVPPDKPATEFIHSVLAAVLHGQQARGVMLRGLHYPESVPADREAYEGQGRLRAAGRHPATITVSAPAFFWLVWWNGAGPEQSRSIQRAAWVRPPRRGTKR